LREQIAALQGELLETLREQKAHVLLQLHGERVGLVQSVRQAHKRLKLGLGPCQEPRLCPLTRRVGSTMSRPTWGFLTSAGSRCPRDGATRKSLWCVCTCCARISATLNRMLDHYGLLHADYESLELAGRWQWACPWAARVVT
jgi:hypothetical protein